MPSDMKKTRTVRLDPSVDERLIALCKHIGTNPNAYMTTEIGKAISRDEVSLRAIDLSTRGQSDFFERLLAGIDGQTKDS